MHTFSTSNGFVLRLVKGEDAVECLQTFTREHQLASASLTGIGACDHAVLGTYSLSQKKYIKKEFSGEFEIASLTGNIAWDGETPFPHLHAVLADEELHAFGGHVFSLRISATCEIVLRVSKDRLIRTPDEDIGLKLLNAPGA